MNNVIGYKDTPEYRKGRWRAMLLIRALLACDRSLGLDKSLEYNKKLYNYMFNEYRKAA